MSFIHALKWSFLAELASKAITPVVVIVLARLLTPEDFGVMSAAMMVIAFSQIFWEAGMGKALIQRQTDVEDAANVAFWINLGLGILIAGLLFWGARLIALTFFQDERVTAVLQVMTLQILLGALASVQTALLQKQMGFKELFWVRLVTVALPGMASIPLAWNGMGYWALVVGALVGQTVQVVLLWKISSWRPSFTFSVPVASTMGRFGSWVAGTGILGWLSAWADSLIVGAYLGVDALGLYRVGFQFSTAIFALLLGPLAPVIYSHLAKNNNNLAYTRIYTEKLLRFVAWIVFPVAMLISFNSAAIEHLLFGGQWNGLGFVISIMVLRQGFASITMFNGEIYRAIGKPQAETYIFLLTVLICLPTYWIFAQIDLTAFVNARLSLVILTLIAHFYLLNRVLKANFNRIFIFIFLIFFGTFALFSFSQFVGKSVSQHQIIQILSFSLSALLFYCFIFFIFEWNNLIKDIRSIIDNKN